MIFFSNIYGIIYSFFMYLSFRTKPEYKKVDEIDNELEISFLTQTMER